MKKYMIIGAVLISSMIFAQAKQPKLEIVGKQVKATYFYDNGQVQQQGFLKDGKLEGKWVAFDTKGNKKSIGEYKNGKKTGSWFFWNDVILSEVDYSNNQITFVKNWKQESLAVN